MEGQEHPQTEPTHSGSWKSTSPKNTNDKTIMEYKTLTKEDFEYVFVFKHGNDVAALPPSPVVHPCRHRSRPVTFALTLLGVYLKGLRIF